MRFSMAANEEKKKEDYFNQAVSILKNRVPVQLLDTQTKGLEDWLSDIKNLSRDNLQSNIFRQRIDLLIGQ